MPYGLQHTELYRTCEDGEVVVREGDAGRDMFVIEAGKVRITKVVGDDVVVLATLERGDFFGEMSLLESHPRDASAVALGPTRLLVIQPGGLLLRIRRDPTFAFEMLHKLSGRVRQLNARIVGLLATRPEASDGRSEVLLFTHEADEPVRPATDEGT
jgi:CRP/FNR family cyclic AMP-dependent transcriptional regulator